MMAAGARRSMLQAAILVVALCPLLAPAVAVAEVYGEVEVEVAEPLPGDSWYGYAEYVFRVTNRSRSRAHEVTIQVPDRRSPIKEGAVRRSVAVQPGQSAVVPLYQPGFINLYGGEAGVAVDGVEQAKPVLFNPRQFGGRYRGSAVGPCVLLGPGFDVDGTSDLNEDFSFVGNDTGHWSSSWLGYSSYAGVVLTAAELAGMEAGERAALLAAVRCGTSLAVIAAEALPADVEDELPATAVGTFTSFGFGRVRLVAATGNQVDAAQMAGLKGDWQYSATPWQWLLGYHRPTLAVLDGVGVPVRGLFLLLVGFVVVIGPVNLVLLRKKRRMLWLLWTAPVVSVVTTGGLLTWAALVEGWTPYVRCKSLTVLDQVHQTATSLGTVAFYAPLAPAQGLLFPADMELTPLRRGRGGDRKGVVDFTSGQHLEGSWFRSRVPSAFRFRRDSRCRERLGVVRLDRGSYEVVNGLGVPISELLLVDPGGGLHTTGQVAAGARVTLEPTAKDCVPMGQQRPLPYDQVWEEITNLTWSLRNAVAVPGTYVALVETDPFVPVGLDQFKPVRSQGVIFGVWWEAEDAR